MQSVELTLLCFVAGLDLLAATASTHAHHAFSADELVVGTVGFTEESWLDAMGHPHSDRLRVIERFHRRDAGRMDIEVTIDDTTAYPRPITYTITTTAIPEDDLLEYFGVENEKSSTNHE
jgi:hypothetical protein